MKTSNTVHTPDMAVATGGTWSPWNLVAALVAALRKSAADRSMRRQLASLDDAILRDIGIDQDEIWRVRNHETFTPRAWM